MNPDMDGWFEVKELRCYACSALEARRESQRKVDLSLRQYVVDTRPPDDHPPVWKPNFSVDDDDPTPE